MKSILSITLLLAASAVPAAAHAAALHCMPSASERTYFINGAAQAGPADVTKDDGFQAVLDGGDRPDIAFAVRQVIAAPSIQGEP